MGTRCVRTVVPWVAFVLGCGSVEGKKIDASQSDSPTDVNTQLGPWQTPVALASVNTGFDDRTPWLSADGLTLYFSSNRTGGVGSYDIWRTTRATPDAAFVAAENVGRLNSTASEESPFVAASGARIWFSRIVTGNGMDILASMQVSGGDWGAPAAVAQVNSVANDGTPMVLANGDAMYLFSRRGANADADIYVARWDTAGSAWQTPTTDGLAAVNTPALELYPHVSSDGLRLYFTSTRDGTAGVYLSTRSTITDPFGAPAAIAELNAMPSEGGIWVSADERLMLLGRADDLYESKR